MANILLLVLPLLFGYFCCAQYNGDGFNIYKDFFINKGDSSVRDDDDDIKELLNKEAIILPSMAAKVHVTSDSTKRNYLFKNLMAGRDTTSLNIPYPVFPSETRILPPRIGFKRDYDGSDIDEINLRKLEFEKELKSINKRSPGSVLTYTIASSKPSRLEFRPESGKHRFQPTSFVATMGK
ncbi:uncharacterized protein LOC111064626 isoform X2 [Nilaparvata lugens]|uniref:uncharacterized protein LOC111064626 isoform X2 n=1 Tax=Nilaparvata lugens TaxID=108931 RepID=UPI00193E4CDB|nr:uncharacterized protein LOC111064626 isoform X2 [Nilaparvata lugens]